MDKLKQHVDKELREIAEEGLTAANLPMVSTLVDIKKDLAEAEKLEKGGHEMTDYGRDYRYNPYGREDYSRGGSSGGRGGYNGGRMREYLNRLEEGTEMYEYGKDRYMHGGDESRVYEGLERMMYAICMFVEMAMNYAETPQEKEIIRKHIQKLSHL